MAAPDSKLQWLVPEEETEPVRDLFESIFHVTNQEKDRSFRVYPPFFVNPGWTMVTL